MAIDPAVLRKQRVTLGVEKPHLTLVPGPRCYCGSCDTCKKRQWMRDYRARQPKLPPQKRGPKMTLGRACSRCGNPISDKNGSGMCAPCHGGWNWNRTRQLGHREDTYSHGGGI